MQAALINHLQEPPAAALLQAPLRGIHFETIRCKPVADAWQFAQRFIAMLSAGAGVQSEPS